MANIIQALLVTKGHDFEREPFFQMIDALSAFNQDTFINWTHVEQPAAQALFHPERAADFDVIVCYDMPGVIFTGDDSRFAFYDPLEDYKRDFQALVEAGKGFVFLHHAAGGWPTWDWYGELIGGKFHLVPGTYGGKSYPGSGYRFRVPQKVTVLEQDHPITQGLDATFDFREEAYLFPVLEDDVVPLLQSDFDFVAAKFPYGGVDFRQHPQGSNYLGWVRASGKSPIAYLQPSHESLGYADDNYRKLVANAVKWAASDEAAAWAVKRVADKQA